MSNSCNPMDYSLPGSSLHGILQARILECVEIVLADEAEGRADARADFRSTEPDSDRLSLARNRRERDELSALSVINPP